MAIPSSVTSIGYSAFSGCSSLTNVTIGNSVTSIGDVAFIGCTSLTAITMNPLNPFNSSADGVLFNKSQTTLILCPGGKAGSYTIPSSVTTIGGGAFYDCSRLTSVTIPNSVTSIGTQAFVGCTSLTNVTIGNSVTNIGEGAFDGDSSLTSVTIPSSVTSIGGFAFGDCGSLTSVTIPGSVSSIGHWTFGGCTSLTNITIPGSVTSIGDHAFGLCTNLMGVYFNGNAPSLGSDVFAYDSNAAVYYLPGTTGWGPMFGDLPTALWFLPNPLVLNGPSFGVKTNSFGFIISWASNIPVVVEACTDLANHTWSPISTNTLTSGTAYFSDPQWANYPARFYRIRSP